MPGSRLCMADREEIRAGLERGDSIRVIARFLGRAASTISREIHRNRSKRGYVAHVAHRRARHRARRPKPLMLVTDAQLRARVIAKLDQKLSPRVISLQLRREGFRVSPETIYRACYHPDGPLGDDAHRQLCRPRRGRVRRRRTSTGRDPKPLGQIRSVHDRKAVLPDEAGHWEGDLLVGKQNRSVIAVLTERQTRLVRLVALPGGRRTDHVTSRIAHTLNEVPQPLRRSLTWDQGRELTAWPRLEKQCELPVYFCDPRSPWQKPLVENVCGLLRRWLPRNQPMPTDQTILNHYAELLNTMPRRSLADATAQDRYDQLVATTS